MPLTLPLLVGAAGTCEPIGLKDLAEAPPGSVVVLGVRNGAQPDLARAARAVEALERAGVEVTVALDAVTDDQQGVLDKWRGGQIAAGGLVEALAWPQRFGFPFAAYEPLFSDRSRPLIAAGVDLSYHPTADEAVRVPSARYEAIETGSAGAQVPAARQESLARAVVAQDQRIAELALARWTGDGVLVLVVDRFRVQGGGAVPDALRAETTRTVFDALLSLGGARCDGDDRVWR